MKQKKIVVIGVALIALVLIVAGVAVAMLGGGDSYAAKVEDGYRFLEAGDYDNAILQFRYAIEEDKTREDAYYGLYQSYATTGNTDLAYTTLQLGYSNTGSAQMKAYLDQVAAVIQANSTPAAPSGESTQLVDDKNVVAALNTELLNLFASANYGDYNAKYGSEAGTLSGGQYTKHIDAIGATLVYYDGNAQRVIDTARGVPYSEYLPNEIRMDNITSLFGGVRSLNVDTLKGLGVENLAVNESTVTFSYGGCDVTILCGADGLITAGCENYIVPTGEVEEQAAFKLAAKTVDATTGGPLSGAKVQAYVGYGTFGQCVEGVTDNAGLLNLDLKESGTYTVVVSKEGYITEQFEVYVLSNMSQTSETFTLSPTISGDGIRLVLTWGASPTDLDSYLIGTASDGTYVNINFTNMFAYDSSAHKIAELDVDDVTSYGPETVTLYDVNGSYEFIVDDYTNSGTIAQSGATVKIYVGSALYATVSVPAGVTDQWHVCTISAGQVTVTNRSN